MANNCRIPQCPLHADANAALEDEEQHGSYEGRSYKKRNELRNPGKTSTFDVLKRQCGDCERLKEPLPRTKLTRDSGAMRWFSPSSPVGFTTRNVSENCYLLGQGGGWNMADTSQHNDVLLNSHECQETPIAVLPTLTRRWEWLCVHHNRKM